jgi:homoserine O-acetyltransferase/O-succinyltransferase
MAGEDKEDGEFPGKLCFMVMFRTLVFLFAGWVVLAQPPAVLTFPDQVEGDWVARDFTFHGGEKLAELRMHYITVGKPTRDAAGHVNNAVLIMHGTGGSGRPFLAATFGGELFGAGQPLDAATHYIILPDDVGHGKSTKPSDGLRMKFPHYNYDDMVRAEHALVHDGLHVDHLRLVMGTSMGAMHTWVWGEMYPDYMDALMPLASAPVEIAGRNRMFRAMIIQSIRNDPEWKNGEYTKPPEQGLIAAQYSLWMMGTSALQLHKSNPTHEKSDEAVAALRQRATRTDANDMLYYFEASTDYNPSPNLDKIQAPLYAVNSADDEVNPPELGILEREIKKVPHGRYILLPITDETRGHGTHSRPVVWKQYLVELLKESEHHAALVHPRDGFWAESAPAVFRVKMATSSGDFTIEAHREWAPRGADRFYNLVRAGFFDDSRFYRVLPNYIAQFGIAGDPMVAAAWRKESFPDDAVKHSNTRATIGYAMTGPNERTTQLYINLKDNGQLDAQGFAPFGEVVEGWGVVEKLYGGYGETSGGGMRAGKQARLFDAGNVYLDTQFPKLDHLLKASVQ